MGERTKISWATSTWNPWYGCHKVSPGCAYCYMDRWAIRSGRDPEKVTRAKDSTFYAPLHWKESQIIFTCSLSDFFIEEADQWRANAWKVIKDTPQHIYLILTKRIQRRLFIPFPNVRLGISVENQYWLNKRLPELFQISAAGYFISAEPLLGPLNFTEAIADWWESNYKLEQIIVGGESGGPKYRRLVYEWQSSPGRLDPKPRALEWVHSIRDQCLGAGINFFFKQWGGPRPESGGHLLDGREYQAMPWGDK